MDNDGYVWWKCEHCGVDKFGTRRGQTLSVKYRERQMTVVGGKVSVTCTNCRTISTMDLDAAENKERFDRYLLENPGRTDLID